MAGGLEAKTNPHVEAWGYSREVVEKTFRFTPRSLALIGLFGIGVPVFIYRSTVKDFVRARSPRARGLGGEPRAAGRHARSMHPDRARLTAASAPRPAAPAEHVGGQERQAAQDVHVNQPEPPTASAHSLPVGGGGASWRPAQGTTA